MGEPEIVDMEKALPAFSLAIDTTSLTQALAGFYTKINNRMDSQDIEFKKHVEYAREQHQT